MTQVRRQSLVSSLFIYIGFAIGLLNFMFLFPNYFSQEEFGLSRIFLDLAQTISAFSGVGISLLYRFNVYYHERLGPRRNDLLTWLFLGSLGLFLIMGTAFYLWQSQSSANPLMRLYGHLVLWLSLGMLLYGILEAYAFVLGRTVLANLLREFGFRVYTLGLILLVFLGIIDFSGFIHLFVSFHALAVLVLAIYLRRQKLLYFVPRTSTLTRRLRRHLLYFLSLVAGSYIFGILSQTIDGIIISKFLGLGSTAVFSIADYMSRLLLVPQRAISAAVFSVLAVSWRKRDMARIQDVYYKSALLQLMAGSFLFANIWLNIDYILSFLPEAYSESKQLVLLLCTAKLIELGTGCNSELLYTSRYWKINLLTYLFLIAFIIPANIICIYFFGLIGSGIAAVLSFSIFNTMRYGLIKHYTGMSPFSGKTLVLLALALASYALAALLPRIEWALGQAVLVSAVFSLVFVFGVLFLRISDDVNNLWNKFFGRIYRF